MFDLPAIADLALKCLDRAGGLQDSFRPMLFGGFLSLGGFVFSMRTFLVVKLKESVYDNESYLALWATARRAGHDSEAIATPLAPLREVADALRQVVWMSFAAALSQPAPLLFDAAGLSVGADIMAVVCLTLAIVAGLRVAQALVIEHRQMDQWVKEADARALRRADAMDEEEVQRAVTEQAELDAEWTALGVRPSEVNTSGVE